MKLVTFSHDARLRLPGVLDVSAVVLVADVEVERLADLGQGDEEAGRGLREAQAREPLRVVGDGGGG